jgi:hypothetical protein
MLRLSRPLKGFVLAGALVVGFLPAVAHAKWIKATVTGTVSSVTAPTDGFTVNQPINIDFFIQNYSSSSPTPSPYTWVQTGVTPNYSQLFGYGTGTNSTGFQGNYNSSSLPTTGGNRIESNQNGTNFFMRVGTNGSSSGINVVQSSTPINVEYFYVQGDISLENVAPSTTDVVDFLDASLGNRGCTSTCTGFIQTSNETPITFSWTNINFSEIEPVPSPIPLTGALAAFNFSRKIRSRIRKSATL